MHQRLKVAVLLVASPALTAAAAAAAEDPKKIPKRGLTKPQVEEVFGQPDQALAPVGEPPITRWRYEGMTVYFEHDRVLHTVVDRSLE